MVDRQDTLGLFRGKPLQEAAVQELAANLRGELIRREDAGFPFGRQHYWKSSFLKHLSDEAIDMIVRFVGEMPSPMSGVGLQQLHGAASRVAPAATAFPHRNEHFDFLILSQWADPADSEKNVEWTRAFFEAMQPFFEGGVYVNNLGEEEGRAQGWRLKLLVSRVPGVTQPGNVWRLSRRHDRAAAIDTVR
jgi:hypothetical protein